MKQIPLAENRKFISILFLIIPALCFGLKVTKVEEVCQLTGEESMNHTELAGIRGTDLGIMVDYKQWILFLFGDTFNTKDIHDSTAQWRSNTLAYSIDTDASDGILFDEWIRDTTGTAKEIIPSKKVDHDEITIIPTAGFSMGNRIWVAYMSVREWGDHGRWNCNYSGYAYSENAGADFKKTNFHWRGDSNFIQLAFAKESNQVYVLGTPSGRFGGVKLAKVNEFNFENRKQYSFFIGMDTTKNIPLWSNKEELAIGIIPSPVGEMSVAWNDYLKKWIMTYLNENKRAIVIRDSPNPWGPWSNEQILLNGSGKYAGLYGAFIHPRYFENNGQTIYFLMSLRDPYNVFLMKATLDK